MSSNCAENGSTFISDWIFNRFSFCENDNWKIRQIRTRVVVPLENQST
jgi:hypothetical protein